jgi:hypothetical protein
MVNKISIIASIFLAAVVGFYGCQETEYSFGEMKAPSNLSVTATVVGVDPENPDGNGSGKVFISSSADNKMGYNIDFGDGNSKLVYTDTLTYTYTNPGTAEYIITVKAFGKGGLVATSSSKVRVFVSFKIPTFIVEALTNNSSRTWMADHENAGFFGVGPGTLDAAGGNLTNLFTPFWWAISPNDAEKTPAYDDEITFTKDANDNIFMTVDNKGLTFMIGAATSFYGFSGADAGYPLVTGDTKKLAFMNATSESTTELSTRIQFKVPGNGIILFGTGATTYEILSISSESLFLRNIGIDGNAWYQRLKVK